MRRPSWRAVARVLTGGVPPTVPWKDGRPELDPTLLTGTYAPRSEPEAPAPAPDDPS